MDLHLESPVQYVPRVGPAMAENLKRLHIHTVGDLLWHAPFRYNDFSQVLPIAGVRPGTTVTIHGEIKSIANVVTKHGKRMQVATVFDTSGKIEIIWFNQVYLLSIIKPGMKVNIAGTVQWFGKKLSIPNPDYEIVNQQDDGSSLHTGRLVPVYPETEGVSSKWLRGRIAYILEQPIAHIPEHLPDEIRIQNNLMHVADALRGIHYPSSVKEAIQSKYRLAFDELLLLQLTAMQKRHLWETTQVAPSVSLSTEDLQTFRSSLPFQLTQDQIHTIEEILNDLMHTYPMNRLLEGDVGAGKTVVAAMAMYAVYLNGYSSVMMAPTQILAEQHYQTIKNLFSHLPTPIHLVTGETNKRKKKNSLNTENSSVFDEELFAALTPAKTPSIYIGTHALLSKSATFENVGLIVIDEQQRFGVDQRKLLREKGSLGITPHILSMTATPIPRTLALATVGDLDLSVIRQMPKGRSPVKTWVVPNEKRMKAYDWMKKELVQNENQAFIVCPLIEESETMVSVKSVKTEFDDLSTRIFPDLRLALLHGKMKPSEKSDTLTSFMQNKYHILVATPVVEVGIDVPKATIIVIEGAERFGLSQLHQLRGRVGRRNQQAYCLLFTESTDEKGIDRLRSLESVHNGPELAEIDLRFRGPGELFGKKQHGIPNLKFADLFNTELLSSAQSAAKILFKQDPTLDQFPLLRDKLNQSIINEDDLSN